MEEEMMIRKGPTVEQIETLNAFFYKPFPVDYKAWDNEDHDRLRQAIEVAKREAACRTFPLLGVTCMILRSFEEFWQDFEAAGWTWDKDAEEWIPPKEEG